MALPVHEQETNIIFMRNSDMAVIYTSDSTTMTKLDKLIALPEGKWKLKETHSLQDTGEIIGKTYTCPKDCISFRKGNKKPSALLAFNFHRCINNSNYGVYNPFKVLFIL